MREMKDSGIEWIGEIPKDWNVKKFKYFFNIIGGNGFKEEYQGVEFGDYPYCKASDINGLEKEVSTAKNYVTAEIADREKYNIIPAYSILISKIGEALKKNHRKINAVPCIVDNNCEAFTLKENDSIDYFYYVLKHIDMTWFDNGGTIPSVNNEKLRMFQLPFPTREIQDRIACYLDSKCALIDSIIAKQEQIIEKLKEYKTSVITEAVTKGLNPEVEMRDSGIEWMGSIPVHWKIGQLCFFADRIGDGLHGTPRFEDSGDCYFVNGNNLGSESISIKADTKRTDDQEYQKYKVDLNGKTLLISLNGTIGNVSKYHDEKIILGKSAGYIRLNDNGLSLDYLKYYLRSNSAKTCFELSFAGTTINNLSLETLRGLQVCIMSKEEQEEIVKYLDKKTRKIDSIISYKSALIKSYEQYKKSLIYEVVTGKKEV